MPPDCSSAARRSRPGGYSDEGLAGRRHGCAPTQGKGFERKRTLCKSPGLLHPKHFRLPVCEPASRSRCLAARRESTCAAALLRVCRRLTDPDLEARATGMQFAKLTSLFGQTNSFAGAIEGLALTSSACCQTRRTENPAKRDPSPRGFSGGRGSDRFAFQRHPT